jgi:hypothetical protein
MDHSPLIGRSAPLKLRLARLWWGLVYGLIRSSRWLTGRPGYEVADIGPDILVYYNCADDEFEHRTGVGRVMTFWAPNGIGQPAGHDGLTPRPPRIVEETHIHAERRPAP